MPSDKLLILILIFIIYPGNFLAQIPRLKTDTVWQAESYQTRDGFLIGIWPHEARIANSGEIKRLKHVFGFSHIYFYNAHHVDKFNMILEGGYAPQEIMVNIMPDNYKERIKTFNGAHAYYIDEPNERDLPIDGMKDEIEKYSPGSLFIISGYRRTSAFTKLVERSDGVMFSSYKHWWQCLPDVWCPWPLEYDQRSDWTDMKERYGEKSFTNWVGAHRDTMDYIQLLEHAYKLGLNGVWLYQFEDPVNSEKNLYLFSDAAWSAGFMKKYERKFIHYYVCYEPADVDCKWILQKREATEEIREAKIK